MIKTLATAVAATALAALLGMALATASAPAQAALELTRDIPARALAQLPTLSQQIKDVWPGMPQPEYFGALIEHESGCPSLKTMCWSPTARLKTQREEGAGLGQLTKAWRADGSLRFDTLHESRRLDPRGLNDLRWDTIYQRPDLQMRVLILMTRATWGRLSALIPGDQARLQMTDAAYNGGLQGLMNDRRACAQRAGCDPNQWFNHVEATCTKSQTPLYGTRSACAINRHHVRDVIATRMNKYKGKV